MCHRHFRHGDTDTNMYLERYTKIEHTHTLLHYYIIYVSSFHNQLKTTYLNGKVNRRVDFLVYHLLEYEKDAFFRYKRDRLLSPAILKKIKQEMNHHQRGLKIPEDKVQVSINDIHSNKITF